MGQTRYPSKSWVFKNRFSFIATQHGQHQLYLQCKVCWILHKMVGAYSFSQPCLYRQLPLESPPKMRSFTLDNFHFPISPLLVSKIILTTPTNTPFLYTSVKFTSLLLHTTIPTFCAKNIFPTSTISPIQAASRDQCARESREDW